MREFSETDEPDCKTCGACCVGSSAEGNYVPVTALDRRRLPTKYQKKLADIEPGGEEPAPYALMLKRFGAHEACIALKGTLGKNISCDVYSQRPDYCRVFERGSEECRERRRAVFYIKPSFGEEEKEHGADEVHGEVNRSQLVAISASA